MTSLPSHRQLADRAAALLTACGASVADGDQPARTPITGGSLGSAGTAGSIDDAVERATAAFHGLARHTGARCAATSCAGSVSCSASTRPSSASWSRSRPARSAPKGLGEVQEMIDICDFAVGLSRQLHGLTIASERPGHRLMETWHPIGPVGVISAFNFPVAVWSWNAALAIVCGNTVIWKPSDKTPLTALACQALFEQAAADTDAPVDVSQVVLGGGDVGAALAAHEGVPIVSATGSTAMGRKVAPVVAARFGRSILELGGNNAAIVAPRRPTSIWRCAASCSPPPAPPGQRCTSLRRLIVHRSIHDELVERIGRAYSSLPIGDPLAEGTLVGPLIDAAAYERMQKALAAAANDGGHGARRWRAGTRRRGARCVLRPPGDRGHARADRGRAHRDVRTDPVRDRLRRVRRGAWRSTTTCRRGWRRRCSRSTCARPSASCRRRGATAASPTSTSARRAPRSAARSAARRRPAAAASRAPTRGRRYMRRATNTINYSTALPLAQGVQFDDRLSLTRQVRGCRRRDRGPSRGRSRRPLPSRARQP